MINQERKQKLDTLLCTYEYVKVAYMYGSKIKGYANTLSDLDIALVVSRDTNIKDIDYYKLYNEVSNIFKGEEVDLRVVNCYSSPLFLFQLINGKCIYNRSKEDRIDFEVYAHKTYMDTQHIRDIYNEYLDRRMQNNTYGN